MISDHEVNKSTLYVRRQLARWRAEAAGGASPSSITPQVSLSIDVLMALRDEAPSYKEGVIDRLIEELESFRKGLSH